MKVTITLILTILCLLVILFCTVKRCADEDKKINMPNNEEDLSKLIDDLSKNKTTRIRNR